MNTRKDFFGLNGIVKYIGAVPMPSWLCYELANPAWDRVNLSKHNRKGIWRIIHILLRYLKAALLLRIPDPKKIKLPLENEVQIIAILNTHNQFHTVTHLLPSSCQIFSIGKKTFSATSLFGTSKPDLALIGMKYFPYLLLEFFFTKSLYKRKSIYYFWGNYLASYGIFRIIRENPAFKNKIIAYSNDHSSLTRPIGLIKDPSIKTIYIPHANVSEQFPPLEMDIAMLYGEDMKRKYQIMNKNIRVELIGNPVYDGHPKASIQDIEIRKKIGFCVNLLDSPETVVPYIEALGDLPYQVYFRPHPRDKRDWKGILSSFSFLDFSDSQLESPPEFISKIRILISGSSSILVDAWGMGVESVQVAISSKNHEDNYGFLEKSELKLISTPEQLRKKISEPVTHPDKIYEKAQFYYVNVGSNSSAKMRFEKIISELLTE